MLELFPFINILSKKIFSFSLNFVFIYVLLKNLFSNNKSRTLSIYSQHKNVREENIEEEKEYKHKIYPNFRLTIAGPFAS